jgi:hypothetical protein
MHTYQASSTVTIKGKTQLVKTEVRAINAQEARWLLWAQYGFHSIQSGPIRNIGGFMGCRYSACLDVYSFRP